MIDRRSCTSLALGLALVGVLAGSAEAQSPDRYRLVEVNGRQLPVEIEKELRCREELTRATLALEPDSTWSLRYTKREVCGDREKMETEHEGGRYAVQGDTIRFFDDDDDDDDRWELWGDVDVDDLSSATRGADGALMVRLRDKKTTLLFRP